jgi:hypothetical protein
MSPDPHMESPPEEQPPSPGESSTSTRVAGTGTDMGAIVHGSRLDVGRSGRILLRKFG